MTALAKIAAALTTLVLVALPTACAGPEQAGGDPGTVTASPTDPDSTSTQSVDKSDGPETETPDTEEPEEEEEEEEEGPGIIQILFGSSLIERCPADATLQVGQALELGVERMNLLLICLADQDWDIPPSMQLTLADGTRRALPARLRPDGLWEWRITPGYGDVPLEASRTYKFTVSTPAGTHGEPPTTVAPTDAPTGSPSPSPSTTSADADTYSGAISVTAATVPRLMAPDPVHPGETVEIGLAGYEPGSQVTVVVYGPGTLADDIWTFPRLTQLPAVAADGAGEARVTWVVPAVTQPEIYGLWLEPLPFGCRELCRTAVTP